MVDGEPRLSALAQKESGIEVSPDGKEKMNESVIDPKSGRPKRVPIGDGTMVTTADGRRVQEYEEDREIHDQVWKEMIGGYYVEAVNSAAEFLQEHKKAVKAGQDVYGSMQRWQDAIHVSKHEPTVVEEEYYKEQGIDPKILKTPMAELEEAAAKTVAAKKKAGDEEAKYSAVPEYPAVQPQAARVFHSKSRFCERREEEELVPTGVNADTTLGENGGCRRCSGKSHDDGHEERYGEAWAVHVVGRSREFGRVTIRAPHETTRRATQRNLNSNTIQSIERNIQSEEAQEQEGKEEEEETKNK